MSKIYVLVGPKGSGKSYIGRLLNSAFGIEFLAIEEIFVKLQGTGVSTPDIQKKGYKIVEERILEILNRGIAASFEITVFTPASKNLLNRLELHASIETIQVYAPLELCLERIKVRDSVNHIEISDERIAEINRLSVEQHVDSKLQIDTSQMTDEQILEEFRVIFRNNKNLNSAIDYDRIMRTQRALK